MSCGGKHPGKGKRRLGAEGHAHAVSVIFENLKAGANIGEIMDGSKVWTANKSKPSSNLPPAALT
jgi:hypothetical protein